MTVDAAEKQRPGRGGRRRGNGSHHHVDQTELHEVVSELAAIHRPSASEGELLAAQRIAERLSALGCQVSIEEESGTGGFWWSVGTMSAAGALAGVAGLALQRRGRHLAGRAVGLAGGLLAAASLADDATAGPHRFRHRFLKYRPTWNLVAETGDRGAEDTVVVMSHHDAAHSGLLFHPAVARWAYERFPAQLESAKETLPYWVFIVGGPALVAAGSAIPTRLGRLAIGVGTALSAMWAGLIADIGRSETVPGANDNATAVAVLVHLARTLQRQPVRGLRVLLLSCGSEETLQEGMVAFASRHFPRLDPERTSFINVETVGSGRLVLVEGEGTLKAREFSAELKEVLSASAADLGIGLIRGMSARSSTDAWIPLRAGYPTALVASLDRYRALANYHWPTDTAENVDFGSVVDCAALVEEAVRRLAPAT